MTEDIRQAFAHPEARAGVATPGPVPDRISLRDHIALADIGAFQQERGHPQRLRFNVVVELRQQPAIAETDDVDRILSYDRISEAIAAELEAERLNLLETLAERIARRILAEPQPLRVFLRIEKLDRGPGALGVEIVRSRADMAGVDPAQDVPRPLIAHLDNATIDAADLAARLDALSGSGTPVILTVGQPDLIRPATGHAPTQRRIDLLEIEQNAWRLAARDPRCVVVSTRTEIDWAMKHGQMVVWAPSKIVLDAHDGPKRAEDGLALALWLADHLDAARVIVHGPVILPAGCRARVERA
jgi:7,8-dihydroneopterin aldolase/epimerase/oxygenase